MKKLFFLEKIDSSQSGEENAYYFELIQFRVSVTHFSSSQGKNSIANDDYSSNFRYLWCFWHQNKISVAFILKKINFEHAILSVWKLLIQEILYF